jgi:hypothetical protein
MRVCEMNFEGLSENRVGVEGNIFLETAILEVEGSPIFCTARTHLFAGRSLIQFWTSESDSKLSSAALSHT